MVQIVERVTDFPVPAALVTARRTYRQWVATILPIDLHADLLRDARYKYQQRAIAKFFELHFFACVHLAAEAIRGGATATPEAADAWVQHHGDLFGRALGQPRGAGRVWRVIIEGVERLAAEHPTVSAVLANALGLPAPPRGRGRPKNQVQQGALSLGVLETALHPDARVTTVIAKGLGTKEGTARREIKRTRRAYGLDRTFATSSSWAKPLRELFQRTFTLPEEAEEGALPLFERHVARVHSHAKTKKRTRTTT